MVGKLIRQASVAQFARTLSIAFTGGVPLKDALATSRRHAAAGFSATIDEVASCAAQGASLADAMTNTRAFPDLAIEIVTVSEANCTLDALLPRTAQFYEEMVENALEGIASLMQPLLIGILCAIVSYLAITG